MQEAPGSGPKTSDGAEAANPLSNDLSAHACERCDVRSPGICVALGADEQKSLKAIATKRSYATEDAIFSAEDPARERAAKFLCLLFGKAKRRGHCGAPIDQPMNRSEIADYLGLAIELRKPQHLSELAAGVA